MNNPEFDPLTANSASSYFGLSYAYFLVLPRSLLQSMPPEWQDKFFNLCEEMLKEFPSYPHENYHVSARGEYGRLKDIPFENVAYRRLPSSVVEEWRQPEKVE